MSADFPRATVIGTPEAEFSGGFVVELSADLGSILQSTVVIGGPASAFSVDDAGAAYIAGRTFSSALPTTANAIQPGRSAGNAHADGFVAKLAPGGGLAYSTYFGGNNESWVFGLEVDASGSAVLRGYTCR